jgi:hypothetical protein
MDEIDAKIQNHPLLIAAKRASPARLNHDRGGGGHARQVGPHRTPMASGGAAASAIEARLNL